jgi:hypothetical protein
MLLAILVIIVSAIKFQTSYLERYENSDIISEIYFFKVSHEQVISLKISPSMDEPRSTRISVDLDCHYYHRSVDVHPSSLRTIDDIMNVLLTYCVFPSFIFDGFNNRSDLLAFSLAEIDLETAEPELKSIGLIERAGNELECAVNFFDDNEVTLRFKQSPLSFLDESTLQSTYLIEATVTYARRKTLERYNNLAKRDFTMLLSIRKTINESNCTDLINLVQSHEDYSTLLAIILLAL